MKPSEDVGFGGTKAFGAENKTLNLIYVLVTIGANSQCFDLKVIKQPSPVKPPWPVPVISRSRRK